ncbi:MAG: serine hydrolase, partial [Patescibacteria group bacterium]
MRRILVLLVLVGFGYWLISNKEDVQALVTGKSRFSVEKPVTEREPFIAESRELAAGFQPILRPAAPSFYVPTAHASIILDADSGDVLYEQNAHEKRQIASLTKLFTATIAVERIKNLDELVTIDEESVYVPGTRIGCPRSGFCNGERLKEGEQVRARDLLKAALMNSANDAATALGKHMGGTQEGFADIMNARAKELGLENSHFCTPSGLEPDGREAECYSSAYDVAKITSEALKHKELWDIMRIEKEIIYSADGKYAHEIFNTDQLLGQLPN